MSKKSRGQLTRELDKEFSIYVRLSASDKNGNTRCVTCGTIKHWRAMDAGHYEPRNFVNTRWREDNVHPQCKGCNIFRKGNYTEYARYLVGRYGSSHLDHLASIKRSLQKVKTFEIEEMIEKYKKLNKQLMKERRQ